MSDANRLMYIDCSDKLQLDESGLNVLRNIPEDYGIATISGVGPGRIGKSSLMNYLHGNNVFEVGSTSARVTKGIWVAIVLDHDKKLATVYFDVEGFGDPKRATVSDTNLLLIVCQHCDVLLYNIRGVFDYEMMEKIIMVGHFFERYRKETQVLSRPALTVVLRDFDLDVPDSPDKELQDLFKQTSEGANLDRSFRSIKAFLLSKPTARKNLSNLKAMTDSQLDPDFVATRNQLQAYLRNEAKPLCTHTNKHINGKVFVQAIVKTVEAVNNDNLSILTITLPELLKEQNKRLKDEAIISYKRRMQSYWPPSSGPEPVHYQWQTSTKGKLQEKLFDIDGCIALLLDQFEVQSDQCFRDLSQQKSMEALDKLGSEIERKYGNDSYFVIGGCNDFESDMGVLEREYKRLRNLGPQAMVVWNKYQTDQQEKEQTIRFKEKIIKRNQEAEKRRIQAQKQIEERNAVLEEVKRKHELMVEKIKEETRRQEALLAQTALQITWEIVKFGFSLAFRQ